ncbi:hypoxanthine phosphoribosyltransferase [Candidatus Woesearchaeota archaeon]|nr:hypoxanthine phosphoribosyltransferase [Candidatus Woesearchaeota archaeon]
MKIKEFISKEKINEKVKEIAKSVVDNSGSELAVVTVLIGAKTFANDLIKEINNLSDMTITHNFVKVSSYSGTESTGKIKMEKDVDNLEGKDVLIVEDVVDTGLTLKFLKDYLMGVKGASSVRICSLLNKPSRRKLHLDIDFVGFEVPDKFIVGYGLDYNQQFRELPFIGILKE